MAKLLRKPFAAVPTLMIDNLPVMENMDKANAFVDHFQETKTTPPNSSPFHNTITASANNIPPLHPIPHQALANYLTSPAELISYIKWLPNNKAPGPDSIPNILLKNFSKKAIVALVCIANAILKLQHFPSRWKESIVIPILKPNKDPSNPSNYRPISLVNTMTKLIEHVILSRLNSHIDDHNLIPSYQFRFRKGQSTVMPLCRTVQDGILVLNKLQSTILVQLDIQKAFDTAWRNGLTHKLAHVHTLPPHLTSLLKDYICQRYIQVRIQNSLSNHTILTAGVPQGTVLYPSLFNLFIADLPTYPTSSLLLFADDTTLYTASFHAQTAVARLQYHLNLLSQYYSNWKIANQNS